jgi:uncharacterized protein (DUF427 family)
MSLTRAHGPLAFPGPREVNYDLDGPKHRLLLHPFPRRVRAEVDGETVFDTVDGRLLHESNLLPVLYVPRSDVREDLLEPTDHHTHCPFKGSASYWTVAGRENAAWGYPDPLPGAAWLQGLVAFYFDRLDAWYDEDEPVRGHLRDPFHRVDARRSSRPVRITDGDELVAESTRAVVLSETGLPNRWYLPREDVKAPLRASEKRTHCPYKGDATYWHVGDREDAGWSYEAPFDGVTVIAGLISLQAEGLEIHVVA